MHVWPKQRIRAWALASTLVAAVVATAAGAVAGPWGAVVGLPAGAGLFFLLTARYWRRRRLSREPFPPAWREILHAKVRFYRNLDAVGRARFEDDVRIFLVEQRIYGAKGARLSDESRVLIAAAAAMLGHGLPDLEWPTVRDIIVYPTRFDEQYRVDGDASVAGEVHAQGPVIFSQRDLRLGFARPRDGHNVALHELAHVLDFQDGAADGVPGDLEWVATAPWIEVVAERLSKLADRGYRGALRDYAGKNEAELFAVAVEAFFERPTELSARDPVLYRMLADYFRQDPAG